MVYIENSSLAIRLGQICQSNLSHNASDTSPKTEDSNYFDRVAEDLARTLPLCSAPIAEGRWAREQLRGGRQWRYTARVMVNPASGEIRLFEVIYSGGVPHPTPDSGIDIEIVGLDSRFSMETLEERIPGILRTQE